MKSVTCFFNDSYRGYDYLIDIDLCVGDKVVVASEYAPKENIGYAIVELSQVNDIPEPNPQYGFWQKLTNLKLRIGYE